MALTLVASAVDPGAVCDGHPIPASAVPLLQLLAWGRLCFSPGGAGTFGPLLSYSPGLPLLSAFMSALLLRRLLVLCSPVPYGAVLATSAGLLVVPLTLPGTLCTIRKCLDVDSLLWLSSLQS